MEPVVLDASITMAWCFDDEKTPYTEELLNWCAAGTDIYVASVWPLEVTNVLLDAQRKGRVTEKRAQEFLEVLLDLPISHRHSSRQTCVLRYPKTCPRTSIDFL